jgi:hypothetical protein
MPYIVGRDDPSQPGESAAGYSYRAAIALVDSQIVNAHWRWLHAVWGERPEELEQAKIAIDALLDRRLEIMRAPAAAA